MAFKGGAKIPWGSCLQALDDQDITRQEMLYLWSVFTQYTRVARVTGQGAQSISWITMIASLPSSRRDCPWAQGQRCCQHRGSECEPSLAAPPLALEECVRPGTSAGGAAVK